MQHLMTGEIDNASSLHKSSEKQREDLEQKLLFFEKRHLESKSLLENILVDLGVSFVLLFSVV